MARVLQSARFASLNITIVWPQNSDFYTWPVDLYGPAANRDTVHQLHNQLTVFLQKDIICNITNSTYQNASLDGSIFSASQDITRLTWNSSPDSRINNSPPLVLIICQKNPSHNLISTSILFHYISRVSWIIFFTITNKFTIDITKVYITAMYHFYAYMFRHFHVIIREFTSAPR